MAASEAAATDVHVHAHPADLAPEKTKSRFFRRKTARADATHARVIPHLTLVDQEPWANRQTEDKSSASPFGSALLEELEAGKKVAFAAAEDSVWSGELMSPFEAIKQVAPRKGEAGNWIIWSAMAASGLARVLLVCLGYLIARGGETRIRAGAVATIFVLVIALSALLGRAA